MQNNSEIVELIRLTSAANYKKVITELWEGWLTNSDNDGADAEERGEKLLVYKQLVAFFSGIEN